MLNFCFTVTELCVTVAAPDQNTKTEGCVFVLRTVMCDCSIDAKTLHVFVLRMFISDCSIRTPKQKLNVYHNNSYDCHAVALERKN